VDKIKAGEHIAVASTHPETIHGFYTNLIGFGQLPSKYSFHSPLQI